MELTVQTAGEVRFAEGSPEAPLIERAKDASRLIEVCLSTRVRLALLYPANLPATFFDLSSGEAGDILQKLQFYGIRLAVVCAPDSVHTSSRFRESINSLFDVFETRDAAVEWLARK